MRQLFFLNCDRIVPFNPYLNTRLYCYAGVKICVCSKPHSRLFDCLNVSVQSRIPKNEIKEGKKKYMIRFLLLSIHRGLKGVVSPICFLEEQLKSMSSFKGFNLAR